ncbi:MAG: hypothetical protein Q9170_000991 [Blastenia crenularia]
MSLNPISLDGRTLEGGGQLLRLALSLSALTYLPVNISDIRANRAPRKANQPAGGLKPAHLAAVEWLARATQAETQGMTKGSRKLCFSPLRRSRTGLPEASARRTSGQATRNMPDGVWQDVYEDGKLIRKDTCIPLSSPGSVCLILQAILPYLLFHFSNEASNKVGNGDDPTTATIPLRVTIEGGTNVSKSPSVEYLNQVLFPMLIEKVGIPSITANIITRGWNSGRAVVGSVSFDLLPFASGSRLSKFDLLDRGEVSRMHVSILASNQSARSSLRGKVTEKLLARYPDVDISFPIEEDTNHGARLYLLIVAETSNGYRLGRDCLWERKVNSTLVEIIADTVVKELETELEHGGCVDEFMQDQLVVFQALAEGKPNVDSGNKTRATLHTQTARWVAEQVLGLNFDRQGTCSGCAFEVGEDFTAREAEHLTKEVTGGLESLEIS